TRDKVVRNVGMPIDPVRVELAIEHLPNLSQCGLQLGFLSGGQPGVWHYPIGHKVSVEYTFGESKFLASTKQQLLGLLHFLLPLNLCFGLCHDQNVPDGGSRTVFVGAAMSTSRRRIAETIP